VSLRPYQVEAVEGVERALADHRSTLLVLPTGTGKTVVFAELVRRVVTRGGRALVIAHREELIRQAVDKLSSFAGVQARVEMGDERAGEGLFRPAVVVASIQTLARPQRRAQFPGDAFALVVVDEAHHAPSASYREVLDHFASAKVLGVTATPDRGDGAAMRTVFESVAYVYEIRDAIEQGFLVPIRQKAVRVEGLDLSRVRTTAGDLNEGDLEAVLTEERNLHGVVTPTLELAGARPTIVFGTSIAHAHALADVFNRYRPGAARAVDGQMDRGARAETLAAFATGEFQFLANCALLTEGVDIPSVACVAMARPTKSRALYAQAVGRGTRLHPGKRDLLIIDFEGNAGKHALVCGLDILDGREDVEVSERAKELLEEDPQLTLIDALDEAARQVAAQRRKKVIAKARYQAVDVSPFEILGAPSTPGRWEGIEATPGQRKFLEGAGISAAEIDKGQASALIEAIAKRRAAGLCTFKQARLLAKHGLNPDVSFARANEVIARLAANRWRLPPELAAAPDLQARGAA
jgi:superfamily II DNA or RNA helicase